MLQRLFVSLLMFVLISPALAESNPDAPYNLDKFKPALGACKLQAPTSAQLIPRGKFADQSNEYFFLTDGQYMTFTVEGDSNRAELRQMDEWKTDATTAQRMVGRLKVFVPEDDTLNQYTWMQIHDNNDGLNKPLIRLVWMRSRKSLDDHLWAAIRTSQEATYEWVDMGPRPEDFFESEIHVLDNRMTVKLNGKAVPGIDGRDVAYWSDLSNYFKAGVYNQDPGRSRVQYDTLQFFRE